MNRGRVMLCMVLAIGLLLSACARSFEHGTPVLEYGAPYGSVDLVGWR